MNSIKKIESCNELKKIRNFKSPTHLILFRGQDKNYIPKPTAARQFIIEEQKLQRKDYEKFVEEFKIINPAINHERVVRTFSKIFTSLYPDYSSWIQFERNQSEPELVQILLQALRQQYSRTALLLDVTTDLSVALKMAQLQFRVEATPIDGRFVYRAIKRNPKDHVFLSVYKVPFEDILNFQEDPNSYLDKAKQLRKYAEVTNGKYFALNCSNMYRAKRLVNQSSYFLSYFPHSKYDLTINKYRFDKIFDREVFQIQVELIDKYFEYELNLDTAIDLFPSDDLVLQWVNSRSAERKVANKEKKLYDDDLGISIYHYFSSLDFLYCPTSLA